MCFSIAYLLNILVWAIILVVIVTLVRIWLLPMLASTDPRVAQTINLLIWAVVVIAVIYFVVDLLLCVSGGGWLGLPRTR